MAIDHYIGQYHHHFYFSKVFYVLILFSLYFINKFVNIFICVIKVSLRKYTIIVSVGFSRTISMYFLPYSVWISRVNARRNLWGTIKNQSQSQKKKLWAQETPWTCKRRKDDVLSWALLPRTQITKPQKPNTSGLEWENTQKEKAHPKQWNARSQRWTIKNP